MLVSASFWPNLVTKFQLEHVATDNCVAREHHIGSLFLFLPKKDYRNRVMRRPDHVMGWPGLHELFATQTIILLRQWRNPLFLGCQCGPQ